jgi:DnaK suppressor protein
VDKNKLEHFRKKLQEMGESLHAGAERTIHEMTDNNDNYPDPTDRATIESDRSFELRIRDRERKLLSKIKSAIERIDDGSYGICEECGEDISFKRLEARPVTTLCIDCKTDQESIESMKG